MGEDAAVPPSRPATTRETVADVSVVLSRTLFIILDQSRALTAMNAAVGAALRDDPQKALTWLEQAETDNSASFDEAMKALDDLRDLLKRFAGESDA